jgi:hypothetical protein
VDEQRVRPSWEVDVELEFGHPSYVHLAEWLHYPVDAGPWWEQLGDLLGGRPGWHCELTSEGLMWSFGALGSSLFNVSWHGEGDEVPTGYELFDYDADETLSFGSVDELRVWLEGNEHRHANHLRDNLRGWVMADDWALLKSFPWKAQVTFLDGTWVGTVLGIPADATFAGSLPDLVGQLRELIADAFDAPASVAPDVSLSVRMDRAATGAAGA